MSEINEINTVSELMDAIHDLRREISITKDSDKRDQMNRQLSDLVERKVAMGRRLDNMRDRMSEAGDVAEKRGTGTGEYGSSRD